MDEYKFRMMTIDDIPDIMEIERASFSLPWTYEAYYNELIMNEFAMYIVLEYHGQIIGFCGSWVIIDEAHITNIAIDPNFRGKKLGEALLRQVMIVVMQKGAKTMTLEVRVSNIVAQNLYRKLGFQNGGIRKRYYTDNYEDALVMWVNLC